jgi:hypothetical protein
MCHRQIIQGDGRDKRESASEVRVTPAGPWVPGWVCKRVSGGAQVG